MLEIKQLMVPTDFHISFPTMEANWEQQLFGSSTYLILCSTEEKAHTGLVNDVNYDHFQF